jgi:hypothetical protein
MSEKDRLDYGGVGMHRDQYVQRGCVLTGEFHRVEFVRELA